MIDKGERLRSGLAEALKGNEHVKEIRGLGLITGIQLDQVSLWKLLWTERCIHVSRDGHGWIAVCSLVAL